MERIFVRFGPIPDDERSKIHCGDVLIGQEEGVSVYEAIKDKDKIQILMPSLRYETCVSLSGCIDRQAYVVEGEVVGKGSDGEPLLRNVRIVEEVTI